MKQPLRGLFTRMMALFLVLVTALSLVPLPAMAAREGTTVEETRKQFQVAMTAGMASEDPQVQAEWRRIPATGEVLTPEDVIAFYAGELSQH